MPGFDLPACIAGTARYGVPGAATLGTSTPSSVELGGASNSGALESGVPCADRYRWRSVSCLTAVRQGGVFRITPMAALDGADGNGTRQHTVLVYWYAPGALRMHGTRGRTERARTGCVGDP